MDEDSLATLLKAGATEESARPEGAPEPQPASEGPARDASGRFASQAPAGGAESVEGQGAPAAGGGTPPPAAQPPAAPPAPEAPPAPGHVPISAMLDEREKRQALERQLAAIKAREAPPAPPEPLAEVRQQLHGQKMDMSRAFAEQKFGSEAVAQAHDWGLAKCDADPAFNQQVFAARDPYAFVMDAYRREQVLKTVQPDELADYQAWKASRQAGGAPPAPSGQTPTPQPPPPPRSLVTAPNAGGSGAKSEVPMGPGAAFGATIK